MAALLNVPETAAPGEIVEIKVLIQHPMETGFRTAQGGGLVPRNIIHTVSCHYMGEEVFSAELFPAVAANPYLAFTLVAEESGEVEVRWTDEAGEEFSQSAPITVG
ncbi:thiosulfate oxidation carrier complex protein SoxZ [Wenxinia marina]|uniref:Sulfur compound chelating protein SoxZ n=1 Tax=Wenxinia marina DSM 24838 TaxID=1123501 RepID=A0A0D0QCK4_9RHOB|nr:thiosulfate oxidation carrier complex protein SoxZ [Wenxinia marina]KIQ70057.1 sulfur compound chelating protein SoxZ [Wenxinia marina DSM 24838]GGL63178.1 thiosulfate oxidation carrier complex protein SoxZ [Wenxinia marina]